MDTSKNFMGRNFAFADDFGFNAPSILLPQPARCFDQIFIKLFTAFSADRIAVFLHFSV